MRRALYLIVGATAVSGCWLAESSVRSFADRHEYATVADAREAELFAQGWLPDVLRGRAGPIAVARDPDSNAYCARAVFPAHDRDALVIALLEYGFDAFPGELTRSTRCPFPPSKTGPATRSFRNGEAHAFAVVGDGLFFFVVEGRGEEALPDVAEDGLR